MKKLAHSKDPRSNELITYQGEVPTYLLPELLKFKRLEITWGDKDYIESINKTILRKEIPQFNVILITLTSTKPALMEFFDKVCPKYEFEIPLSNYDNTAWDKQLFKSKKSIPVSKDDNKILWDKINQNKKTDIRLQAIAEQMYDAYNESEAIELRSGEWHLPYKFTDDELLECTVNKAEGLSNTYYQVTDCRDYPQYLAIGKINNSSITDCRVLKQIYDQLVKDNELDTFVHCARVMSEDEYNTYFKGKRYSGNDDLLKGFGICDSYKGFINYKNIIENGNTNN